jgi:hypothetical protein
MGSGSEIRSCFMGAHEGRARVGKSVKELMLHWSETRMNWDDASSQAFEARHLTPLEQDARKAIGAMDGLVQVLQQIKRDCEQ